MKKKETKESEKSGFASAPGLALGKYVVLPSVISGTLGKLPSLGPTHSILGFRKRRIQRKMKKKILGLPSAPNLALGKDGFVECQI